MMVCTTMFFHGEKMKHADICLFFDHSQYNFMLREPRGENNISQMFHIHEENYLNIYIALNRTLYNW